MADKPQSTSGHQETSEAPATNPAKPSTAAEVAGSAETADGGKDIEAQVDALLEQAQLQVDAMSDLVNEPAPKTAAADAGEAESEESVSEAAPPSDVQPGKSESSRERPFKPDETAALQGEVDAILAEANAAAERVREQVESSLDPPVAQAAPGEEPDTTPAAETDLEAVDAVIADAASRALEEDELETPAPTASAGATAPAAADRTDASRPAPDREAGGKVGPVKKGGDASMRRKENRGPAPRKATDLDGLPPAAKSESVNKQSEAADTLEPEIAESAPLDPRLRAKIARYTLQGMAIVNAPWHSWPASTRYAVLAFTALNVTLATAAYFMRLWRWI